MYFLEPNLRGVKHFWNSGGFLNSIILWKFSGKCHHEGLLIFRGAKAFSGGGGKKGISIAKKKKEKCFTYTSWSDIFFPSMCAAHVRTLQTYRWVLAVQSIHFSLWPQRRSAQLHKADLHWGWDTPSSVYTAPLEHSLGTRDLSCPLWVRKQKKYNFITYIAWQAGHNYTLELNVQQSGIKNWKWNLSEI